MRLEVKGLSELSRKLERKVAAVERRVYREALLAFAEPIRAAAESYARSLISPRLEFVTQVSFRRGTPSVKIGPSTKPFQVTAAGRTVTHSMIAYWFEFGFEIRETAKGPSLAHVGARPTLTPAFQQAREAGLAAMESVLRKHMEAEAA